MQTFSTPKLDNREQEVAVAVARFRLERQPQAAPNKWQ
jgi:hypothetical protein